MRSPVKISSTFFAVPTTGVKHHLERDYRFKDFREALSFVNRVGEMAEQQNHHPDLLLSWGRTRVTVWTHKIDGLTESDFVFAAKCDRLYGA